MSQLMRDYFNYEVRFTDSELKDLNKLIKYLSENKHIKIDDVLTVIKLSYTDFFQGAKDAENTHF